MRAGLAMMLSPFLIGTAILVGLPVIFTVALAFTDYDALSPPVWQGFQNFGDIASERVFQVSMRNSFLFVALAVPLRIFGALALALLLHHRRQGSGLYRVSVFLPTVVPDVAYALIWLWIFNPLYGPLNLMLECSGAARACLARQPQHRVVGTGDHVPLPNRRGFCAAADGAASHPAGILRCRLD